MVFGHWLQYNAEQPQRRTAELAAFPHILSVGHDKELNVIGAITSDQAKVPTV